MVKAAGVAQGTFYLYFKSKKDILAELQRTVFADYARVLAEACAKDAPADERLFTLIEDMTRAVRKNRDLERLLRASESALDTEEASLEGRARLAKVLGRLVDDAKAEGMVKTDYDTGVASHLLVTLFSQVLYEAIAYKAPAGIKKTKREGFLFAARALGLDEGRSRALAARLAK